jgi:hypothetical protein
LSPPEPGLTRKTSEEEVWGELADLFFLDLETGPEDIERVASVLRRNGWSRQDVERTLVELIAPVAARHVLLPINSIWTGFDRRCLSERIAQRRLARATQPRYRFWPSDWWWRRMMRALDWEQLLRQLP